MAGVVFPTFVIALNISASGTRRNWRHWQRDGTTSWTSLIAPLEKVQLVFCRPAYGSRRRPIKPDW